MKKVDIEFIKGDTYAFDFEVQEIADIDSAFFSCKEENDNSTNYVFQKRLTDGITKNAETGTYSVRVAPEDTATLEAGTYYYDLQIGIGTDIFTLLIGKLTLVQDVTIGGE